MDDEEGSALCGLQEEEGGWVYDRGGARSRAKEEAPHVQHANPEFGQGLLKTLYTVHIKKIQPGALAEPRAK